MSFTLPDLPYSYDALAPYMSRETLEYPPRQASPRLRQQRQQSPQGHRVGREIARGHRQRLVRQECRALQQCRPALQPHPFLEMDEAAGRRRQDPRRAREEDHRRPRLGREDEGGFHPGGRHPVRLGLVLACGQGRQDRHRQDGQRRKPAGATAPRRSSAATCGSIPTTSTIATGGRITSRPGSTTSSTGSMWRNFLPQRRNSGYPLSCEAFRPVARRHAAGLPHHRVHRKALQKNIQKWLQPPEGNAPQKS